MTGLGEYLCISEKKMFYKASEGAVWNLIRLGWRLQENVEIWGRAIWKEWNNQISVAIPHLSSRLVAWGYDRRYSHNTPKSPQSGESSRVPW